MKKLIKLILILIVAYPVVGIAITACSDDNDCSMGGRPMMYCNFYALDRTDYYHPKASNDTLDSLTVRAFGTDSIIINNQKKVHQIALPLQYTRDTTVFVLWYKGNDPRETDTLTVVQENVPYFQSLECGYTMRQTIQGIKYTRHDLDSIKINSDEANTTTTENLRLLLRMDR